MWTRLKRQRNRNVEFDGVLGLVVGIRVTKRSILAKESIHEKDKDHCNFGSGFQST